MLKLVADCGSLAGSRFDNAQDLEAFRLLVCQVQALDDLLDPFFLARPKMRTWMEIQQLNAELLTSREFIDERGTRFL